MVSPLQITPKEWISAFWTVHWIPVGLPNISKTTTIEWPYVALLIGIVVMLAAALHLLPAWLAWLIFTVLWIGFVIWSKIHR